MTSHLPNTSSQPQNAEGAASMRRIPFPIPPMMYGAYGHPSNQPALAPYTAPDGTPLVPHSLPPPYQSMATISPGSRVMPSNINMESEGSYPPHLYGSSAQLNPLTMYPPYIHSSEPVSGIPMYLNSPFPSFDPTGRAPFMKPTDFPLSSKLDNRRSGDSENNSDKDNPKTASGSAQSMAMVGSSYPSSSEMSSPLEHSDTRQLAMSRHPTFSLPPPYSGFTMYDPNRSSSQTPIAYTGSDKQWKDASQTEQNASSSMNPMKADNQEQASRSTTISPPKTGALNAENPSLSPSDEKTNKETSPSSQSAPSSNRKLKVEDALAYLEQVKTQFNDQPHVYNKFLDIMKDFKSQAIDTNGVMARVSELFRGHPNLILGFNAFLPPGCKIEVPEAQVTENYYVSSSNKAYSEPLLSTPYGYGQSESYYSTYRPSPSSMTYSRMPIAYSENKALEPTPSLQKPNAMTDEEAKQWSQASAGMSNATLSSAVANKPVELDQAIHYVKKIKQRFAMQPQVYRQFLDILHSYQKEQKSIKQVYEQVATLFQHHVDLLEEFTNFLPESASQAKASKSFATSQDKSIHPSSGNANQRSQPYFVVSDEEMHPRKVSSQEWKASSKQPKREEKRKEAKKRQSTTTDKAHESQVSRASLLTKNSMILFEQIRKELGPEQKYIYSEFIKCLSLFSQGIISRAELLMLCQELFAEKPALYEAFQTFLQSSSAGPGAVEEAMSILQSSQWRKEYQQKKSGRNASVEGFDATKSWSYKPLSEIALESEETCTVSYRKLPDNFPRPSCSGRGPLENAVLNDSWVSLPTGSEDFSFKHMRKNQYEDNLFRCEDDRYELDMVIETNAATIAKLEPIAAAVQQMTLEQRSRYALAEGILSPIHLKAIERIYGEHGPSVVEQVKQSPSVTVGIVLSRLKQKDVEWRRTRLEMNKMWRETVEKNYYKSLDHRSFYFKQTDRKALNSKSLVAQVNHDSLPAYQIVDSFRHEWAPNGGLWTSRGLECPFENSREQSTPCMGELCKEDMEQVLDIVMFSLNVECGEGKEANLLYYLFSHFMLCFFRLSDSMDLSCPNDVLSEDVTPILGFHWQLVGRRWIPCCSCEEEGPFSSSHLLMEQDDASLFFQGNVFYGDESLYILFRLFHLLYNRLAAAQQMAQSQAQQARERASIHNHNATAGGVPMGTHSVILNHDTTSSQTFNRIQSNAFDSGAPVATAGTTAEQLFEEYLSSLKSLLDGSLETSKYEDRCRSLLGTNSYILFTMDKLIARLIKQIQTVFHPNGGNANVWLYTYYHLLECCVEYLSNGTFT
ncbi:paired amphipathic helix protein Sin3a [Galdieria sulphuraria]|uniref:Paired amphipathic helix protein Sin3a n=1 Tax=Galdieria sulphuraria TaxID=130081 RepID=M2XFN9_GALSU|nr:paired amphipathic helix protein Sin3a [Galdieria sulphuraria]EME28827.1 paired amphipathic helix protein Sin3a [Galdieria sulphuraria]|eukprot:XP_005705347.1 paired amphipathic helix protein Sin3a [Galdieria sulphuraria]